MENKERAFGFALPPLSVGIDLVEIAKIRKLFEHGKTLRESIFTPEELRHSWEQKKPYTSLAVFFAFKKALFKALETGLGGTMDWRDVEIGKETDGTPVLHLCGETARVVEAIGVVEHAFCLSHTEEYGIAIVLLVGVALQNSLDERVRFLVGARICYDF